MNGRIIFLPFAAFLVLTGYIGWQMGQPLSATDVLDLYAAEWVATGPEGAAISDCHGVPAARPEVWIVVTCAKGDVIRQTEVAFNGRRVAVLEGPQV